MQVSKVGNEKKKYKKMGKVRERKAKLNEVRFKEIPCSNAIPNGSEKYLNEVAINPRKLSLQNFYFLLLLYC